MSMGVRDPLSQFPGAGAGRLALCVCSLECSTGEKAHCCHRRRTLLYVISEVPKNLTQ